MLGQQSMTYVPVSSDLYLVHKLCDQGLALLFIFRALLRAFVQRLEELGEPEPQALEPWPLTTQKEGNDCLSVVIQSHPDGGMPSLSQSLDQ